MAKSASGILIPEGAREIDRRPRESVRIIVDGMTFSARMTNCNKPNCKKCPHGPYWSRIIKTRGREIEKYIGVNLIPCLARRWVMIVAEEWNQLRLPGLADCTAHLPPERPPWLPPKVWEVLARLEGDECMTQEKIDVILASG